jgi:hypothetical protein
MPEADVLIDMIHRLCKGKSDAHSRSALLELSHVSHPKIASGVTHQANARIAKI